MDLKVGKKSYELKYNFASLKLWEKKLVDEKGNKQSHEDMFDEIFSGLVNNVPETLVNVVYGGLAYLDNNKPSYGDVFNAVSDVMGNEGLDKLSEQLMSELTAFGFFKVSMKQWRDSMKRLDDLMVKGLKELKKPAKNAKDEAVNVYNRQKATLENTRDGLQTTLGTLDKRLKAIGITL